MDNQIDVCGLECPQPVVKTKKALEKMTSGKLHVVIDSEISFENIKRFAASQGYPVDASQQCDIYRIVISKEQSFAASQPQSSVIDRAPQRDYVVYVAGVTMGNGEEALGQLLMRSFFKTILEATPLPTKILFVNSGIFLTIEGSPLLATIAELAQKGVVILSCGTCLDYYKRTEQLRVGVVTNMFEIVDCLKTAEKVVRP